MEKKQLKEKGQVIRVHCKRCGKEMVKWQRSNEDEELHPFVFDRICGFCITEGDLNLYTQIEGLIMEDGKEIKGIFTFNSNSTKYNKFIFETPEGVVGNIFIPKDIKNIPSQIYLQRGTENSDGTVK